MTAPASPLRDPSDHPPGGAWDLVALALALAYALGYPHGGFDAMVPDNIAQVAYFELLGRPELVGSIGSSAPKGGLIVLLGLAHHAAFDLLDSAFAFKAFAATFYAVTLWLIARIAADVGGPIAGALALLAGAGSDYLTSVFATVSSNLFFVPLALLGLLLVARHRERAGVAALALASTIRPEGLLVIASVALTRALIPGRWARLAGFVLAGSLALAFFACMARWTQGSWARAGAGAATGYPAFADFRTLEHVRETLGALFGSRSFAWLAIPAVFALAVRPVSRTYLHFLPMTLAFVVLVGVGYIGMHYRYVAATEMLVIALGCAGVGLAARPSVAVDRTKASRLARAGGALACLALLGAAWWATGSARVPAQMLAVPGILVLGVWLARARSGARLAPACHLACVAVVAGAGVLSAMALRGEMARASRAVQPSVADGREFLAEPVVPAGARLIAEDETLNYVVARAPERISRALSLQAFNVLDEAARSRALHEADYLYVSKRRNRGWNYLYYFPRAKWIQDPFRQAVTRMVTTNAAQRLLGARMDVVYHSRTRLVARIAPE